MSKLPDAKQTLEFAAVATLGSIIGLALLMLIEQIFGFRFPASYVAAGLLVAVCDLGRRQGSDRGRPRRRDDRTRSVGTATALNETTNRTHTRAFVIVGTIAAIALLMLTDRLFGFAATYVVGGILIAVGLIAEMTGPAAGKQTTTAANGNSQRITTSHRLAEIGREAAGLHDRPGF